MKVVHEFVDGQGKTNFDEFKLHTPLDMGDVPKQYHVVLNTAANAARLSDLAKTHLADETGTTVITGCPHVEGPHSAVSSWEVAKVRVRELCFENAPAVLGGLRRATLNDAMTSDMVCAYDRVKKEMTQVQHDSEGNSLIQVNLTPHAISQISGHFLWKRLHWVAGVRPFTVLSLIGLFVDPTWLTDDDAPTSCRRFLKVFMGGAGRTPFVAQLTGMYQSIIAEIAQTPDKKQPFEADPALFALRYGMRWSCKHMRDGVPDHAALLVGVQHAIAHVGRYVWLSWMSMLHPKTFTFDREKFFGDHELAEFAYKECL